MLRARKRLICGVGVNDADYNTTIYSVVNGSSERVYSCPFYKAWTGMLARCYRNGGLSTYKNVSVCEEWKYFSNFKAWMEQQDWEGKSLDKDLLVKGNKIYSPETCVFIDRKINLFIREMEATKGEWPIGVYKNKNSKKWQAQCCNPFTGILEYLGLFTTPIEAHRAWLSRKLELAKKLAEQIDEKRIAEALMKRYEDYDLRTSKDRAMLQAIQQQMEELQND